jgi:hypothetical protein
MEVSGFDYNYRGSKDAMLISFEENGQIVSIPAVRRTFPGEVIATIVPVPETTTVTGMEL